MSSVLYRLGSWAFTHRLRVLAVWGAVLVLAGTAAGLLTTGTDNTFSIPGTESTEALNQLDHTFPQVAGSSAQLVVVAPEGISATDASIKTPVEAFITTVKTLGSVEAVADPYGTQVSGGLSTDGRGVLVTVQVTGQSTSVPTADKDAMTAAKDTLAAAVPSGTQVALGGAVFSLTVPAASATEGIGVLVALVVLLFTFGSLLAAGMPLLNALVGVGITVAGIYATTRFTTIVSTTPLLSTMLGLAVGIDYTLFIVSRYRDQLSTGMDLRESAARSLATSGAAVVFAGLTVMIALVGLGLAGLPFLTVMGVAGAIGVGMAVLVSLTMTPAILGLAGERLRPRGRRAGASDGSTPRTVPHNRFFSGWVRAATRWPVVTVLIVVVGLGALTLPARSLHLALPDAGSQPAGSGARQTYDLVGEHWGAGYNGPLILTAVIVGSTDPLTLMADLKSEIESMPGVASVPIATPNSDATVGIVQIVPQGAPDSQATVNLVHELRANHARFQSQFGVDTAVTGVTAVQIDVSAKLGQALVPFGLFVVGLSFLLLTMVFRSLWVPLKATVGYLLSVGSAFGAVSLVFEHGVGASLLGLDRTPQAVLSFMPIIVMGVLFGLAMDYEVFLVSRMREEYVHRGDARRSVTVGFMSSAKVVTAAALIMFSVFIAFVPGHDTMIKPIALGLAVGVAVDAFVVRMTLVPAVLWLLGERAWHMPPWLERTLPHFDVEGEGLEHELSLADWPEPDADDAITAHDLRLDAPDGTPLVVGVSVRVARGGVLLVTGAHRSGRTPLLMTLAGRAHSTGGVLKVTGLVASVRARDIRHRVAYARLARSYDPVGELDGAFESGAPVVVVDDLDAVSDPYLRDRVRERLAAARRADPGMTLVVSALTPQSVSDLVTATALVALTPERAEVRR